MEGHHSPLGIGIGFQSVLQEGFVFRNGQVGGVDHHEQHAVVGEGVVPVAAVGFPEGGGVGGFKVLHIQGGIVAVVVVAHQHLHGQALQHIAGQVAVVLGFHRSTVASVVVGVDLVAHGEQEIVVGSIGVDGVQGVIPAVGVAFIVAGRTDLGVAHYGDVQRIGVEVPGGVGVGLGGVAAVLDVVLISGVFFQTGDGHGVDGVPFPAGRFGGGGVAGAIEHQGVGGDGGVVPHKGHLGFICAHVHQKVGGSKGVGVGFAEGQLFKLEVHVGAAGPSLVEFHRQDVGAVHQHGGVGDVDFTGEGVAHVAAPVLHVLGDVLIVEPADLHPVQVNGGGVVIQQRAGDQVDGVGVFHFKGGAEEEGRDVVPAGAVDVLV